MTTQPVRPKIFHITHVDNLRSIVVAGELLSDASMIARGGSQAGIGMSTIKQRRLALPVTCHANDHVGDYVPFYFCARSIMLFVIHCANHPDLTYRGGQAPIVHLQADVHAVVAWARQHHRRWAFSLSNAGARYASFRADPADLDQIDWNAVASTDFRSPTVKEAKQAEFLVHGSFPWDAYQQACKRHEVQPGRMLIVETGQLENPRWVINFPTKRHWRGNSRIEDIDAGLAALVADVRRLGIQSIAVPPLGCGLGGLAWTAVRPRIEQAFAALPGVTVLLFEPDGAPPPEEMIRSTSVPTMTPGRAVLVGLIERYLAGLMDPFVSLLEIHKLMYFMQEAGEPLRLLYTKALYGPYAENLRQVLAHVEGHFLTGYADGGDAPDKQLELVPGASKDARAFLEAHPETKARFDRVAELVQGFETPFGMELLATVHWVAVHDGARTIDEAVDGVYQWNDRKRAFEPRQLQLAWDVLGAGGWLRAEPAAARTLP